MNEKEFVLVSQGIEIYRTKSQEIAVNMVKKENDEYFDYRQRCVDNYERPADNYIDLEIEYPDEKDLQKRINKAIKYIEQLKTYPYLEKYYVKNLERILKGEDKE